MAVVIPSIPAPPDNYVLLTAGGLRLLLPLQEVGEAEYLDGELCTSDEPGRLRLRDVESERRYIALSEHMYPMPQCPPGRFMFTRVGADDLGWCWDDIQVLHGLKFGLEPLPSVLLAQFTPFTHYIELDGQLAYLCTAQLLRAASLGEGQA